MGKFSDEARAFLGKIISTRREKTPFKEEIFVFRSRALPEETFHVINFVGEEKLSDLYRFTLNLASEKNNLDIDSLLAMPVLFIMEHPDGRHMVFHGVLSEFQQLHHSHGLYFYRATMVPKLWWLTQTRHNQIFLDQTAPEIIEAVLKDGGLTTLDYEFRLANQYTRTYEYVCQYGETHYDFLCRWLEREGMYFFFELTNTGEKLIITDSKIAHDVIPQGDTVRYSPPSGLPGAERGEVLNSFSMTRKRLPQSIAMKDYNDQRPSLDLSVHRELDSDGLGSVYFYGDNYLTTDEGERLAGFRAEAYQCQETTFQGQGSVPFLRPGYLFNLEDHYRDDWNQKFLTISIQYEGNQSAYIRSGLSMAKSERDKEPYFKNSFTAIPSDVQYRSEMIRDKPRIHGTIHAHIDAAGEGQYAELDSQGRYKVILPFDLSGRDGGRASAWVRQVQPYSGSDHGFHFPLHKGTEVVLSFINGDPDRPVIAGSLPNPLNPSPVKNENQTQSVVHTAGGNHFELQDLEGRQRVFLSTPHAETHLHMGASPQTETQDGDELELATQGSGSIQVGEFLKTTTGAAETPQSTVITDQTTTGSGNVEAGPPQTGDDYVTTARNFVQNTGADHFLNVKGNKLGQAAGDSTETVKGNYGLAVDGTSSLKVSQAATQSYGSTLSITAADSISQKCAKDAEFTILGNQYTTITGKDTRTVGHKSDTIMGATETTRLGGFNLFTLGVNSAMNVGAVSTINLAGVSTVNIGLMFAATVAAQLLCEQSAVIKVGTGRVDARRFETKNVEFKLDGAKTLIQNTLLAFHEAGSYIVV